jgi:hypothetical protein
MSPSLVFVYALAVGLIGLIVGSRISSASKQFSINKLTAEIANQQQMLDMAANNRRSDNSFIKQLSAESEINRADAERYRLVRYFIEHDHGELAIEAFYGPQAILTAGSLDLLLDEELDKRYLLADDHA